MNNDPMDTSYRPIACALYDQYEMAITQRRRLHLVWQDGNVIHDRVVTPTDLRTSAGEEFLVVRLPEGETIDVRLDRIRRVDTP